jgi:oxygen-independent coproporphyrinogen-3 oxidase
MGLAKYLSTLNYDCWLLDFQGHGFSDSPEKAPDFESMCLEDTKAALDYIYKISDMPIWWVGHSGGGLAILMYLARYPQHQNRLAGVVTLASQATDAGLNWRHRTFFQVLRLILRVIGTVPGKALGLGPESEFSRVLDQWLRWSIAKRWTSIDGIDYLASLADIHIPQLVIAGIADKFLAPVSGCEKLYENIGSVDKTFLAIGEEGGFLEDYTHARLVSSRNASIDVWPLVGQWLLDRSYKKD